MFVLVAFATAPIAAQEKPMTKDILAAVSLYASFDERVAADFGGGELAFSTRMNHETEAGKFVFQPGFDVRVFQIAKGQGISGGALSPQDVLPRNGRIFLPAKGNIGYRAGGWGGAVSFWLNTDPNTLLKTRFCDPVQITHKGANDGGLWFDFNDAKPRDARMGFFPAVVPGKAAAKESDEGAPLVRIPAVGFKSGEWHHVVLNWQNFDTGRPDAETSLFIDGNRIGGATGRDIAMAWDLEKTGIYVAVNYLGLLDELAVFNRMLTDTEVAAVHAEPAILAALLARKAGSR
jgi:hypothetical protein